MFQSKGTYHLPKLLIFASEECHYSIHKYAAFLGIGENNVVTIQTDDVGAMVTTDLERKVQEAIDEGAVPIAVVATFGKSCI